MREYHVHGNAKAGRRRKGHWRHQRDGFGGRVAEVGDHSSVRMRERAVARQWETV